MLYLGVDIGWALPPGGSSAPIRARERTTRNKALVDCIRKDKLVGHPVLRKYQTDRSTQKEKQMKVNEP